VPSVVNGLMKGAIGKPSSQYLSLICDESLTCRGLNSCGESRLLVSWCAGSRCDTADNNEDLVRNRRPSSEDRGWSSTSRVLDGRMIGRSGDTVCGLHHAHGDEGSGFLD
jgi:hypothetical protein